MTVAVTAALAGGLVAIADAQEPVPATGRPAIAFVVDVSGSMSGTPLQQAKDALTASIDALRPTDTASLRAYSGTCGQGGQRLVTAGTDNRAELRAAVDGLVAGGGTPTPEALAAGVEDFPAGPGRKTLVLISDGASSCGDPCPVAAVIKERLGVDFKAFTVGFRASDQAENELSCIAQATGGQYFSADDAAGLRQAIDDAIGSTGGVPLGQLYGPGGGYARNPSGRSGDPVNTATGAFVASTADAALLSGAGATELSRSYTSADPTVGPLGRGWTHSLAATLTIQSTGVVVARAGTGQELIFSPGPDGTFRASPGAVVGLTRSSAGFVLAAQDGTRETFDAAGRLVSRTDRSGRSMLLSYDGAGRLARAEASPGRAFTFSHNADGRLTRASLPDGRFVEYGYTGDLLTSVRDLTGGTTRHAYTDAGLLAEVLDQAGNRVVRNEYAADGRVAVQTDAVGARTSFAWDTTTETSVMTDPRGNRWTDVYQGGLLVRRIDPLGNQVELAYDDDLNVTSVTDALGRAARYTYDTAPLPTGQTGPGPEAATAEYRPDGLPSRLQPPGGDGFAFSYDDAGRLTSTTQPGGAVLGLRRNAAGLITSFVDPLGSTVTYEYDGRGDPVAVRTPSGARTTFAFDASGRPTSTTDPLGRTTTVTYDAADRVVRLVDGARITTAAAYDRAGRLSSITDGNGRITTYGWDAAGRLVSVGAPDGATTRYGYDAAGNLTSIEDALRRVTTFGYDAANRRTRMERPGDRVWTYAFDAASNLTAMTDANGNATPEAGDGTTRFAYDADGRTTAVDYSDDTPDVRLGYSPAGQLTRMDDGLGTQTFAYDRAGQMVESTRGSDVFRYTYDKAGRLTSRQYPSGAKIDYGYDSDDRLVSLTADGGTTRFAYDAAGNLLTRTLPSGAVERLTYDGANRLVGTTTTSGRRTIDSRTLTLDGVGNPVRIATPRGTDTYAYDNRNRLSSWCPRGVCALGERYTWDAVGNRLSLVRPGRNTTVRYNEADQPVGAGAPRFDRNGNQLVVNGQEAEYDLANRLVSLAPGRVPRAAAVTIGYDGTGNRISERIISPVRRTDVTLSFAHDVNAAVPLLAEQRGPEGALTRYTYSDLPESVTAGGSTAHLVRDHIGSTTALLDGRGQQIQSYDYTPFGREDRLIRIDRGLIPGLGGIEVRVTPDGITIDLGGAGLGRRDGPARANALTYAGQYWDGATGTHDMRARLYDPAAGRFLQVDPLPSPPFATANSPYAYVDGRPTALIDPTGLNPFLITGLIGAGIGVLEYAVTTPADQRTGRGWVGAAGGGFVAGAIPGGSSLRIARTATSVATRSTATVVRTPGLTVSLYRTSTTVTRTTTVSRLTGWQAAGVDAAGGFTGALVGGVIGGNLTPGKLVFGAGCSAASDATVGRASRNQIASSLLSDGACALLSAAYNRFQGLSTFRK